MEVGHGASASRRGGLVEVVYCGGHDGLRSILVAVGHGASKAHRSTLEVVAYAIHCSKVYGVLRKVDPPCGPYEVAEGKVCRCDLEAKVEEGRAQDEAYLCDRRVRNLVVVEAHARDVEVGDGARCHCMAYGHVVAGMAIHVHDQTVVDDVRRLCRYAMDGGLAYRDVHRVEVLTEVDHVHTQAVARVYALVAIHGAYSPPDHAACLLHQALFHLIASPLMGPHPREAEVRLVLPAAAQR